MTGQKQQITERQTRDTGQLFVLTAVVVAFSLLLIAFALNVAIFNESTAHRTTDVGDDTTVEITKVTKNVGEELVLSVQKNGTNSTYSELNDSFNESLWTYSRVIETEFSRNGATTTVNYTSMVRGTKIEQKEKSTFTWNNSDITNVCISGLFICDSGNWTLVKDTSNVRSFNQTIDQEQTKMIVNDSCTVPSLLCADVDDAIKLITDYDEPVYSVDVSDGSQTKIRTYIFEECRDYQTTLFGGNCDEHGLRIITVNAQSNTVLGQCYFPDNDRTPKEIDYHRGTVNGTQCDAISEFSKGANKTGVGGPGNTSTLHFRNATEATGTYELYVDTIYSKLKSTGNYNTSLSEAKHEPTISYAIYGVRINTGVQTEEELIHIEVLAEPEKVL